MRWPSAALIICFIWYWQDFVAFYWRLLQSSSNKRQWKLLAIFVLMFTWFRQSGTSIAIRLSIPFWSSSAALPIVLRRKNPIYPVRLSLKEPKKRKAQFWVFLPKNSQTDDPLSPHSQVQEHWIGFMVWLKILQVHHYQILSKVRDSKYDDRKGGGWKISVWFVQIVDLSRHHLHHRG